MNDLCPLEGTLEDLMQIELTEDLETTTMSEKPEILTWQKARELGPSPDLILKLCEVYGEQEVVEHAEALGWPPIAIISDLKTGRRVADLGGTIVEAQYRARMKWSGQAPDGYTLALEGEVVTLHKALKNLVLAVERVMREGDEWDSDDFDHYEAARGALGSPIEPFPGGPEGEHFHWLEFDPEEDECGYCDQEAQRKEKVP